MSPAPPSCTACDLIKVPNATAQLFGLRFVEFVAQNVWPTCPCRGDEQHDIGTELGAVLFCSLDGQSSAAL